MNEINNVSAPLSCVKMPDGLIYVNEKPAENLQQAESSHRLTSMV
jgi:hypothetical protein